MAGKSPDRHWKTADYEMLGQLKRLESEQAELFKTFDGRLADVKSQLAQKKAVSAEKAYQCFFETYDELEENRQQQRLILKPKYFETFDNDTQRILEEISKLLRWVVKKVAFLRDIEIFCTEFVGCRKDTLRAYKLGEATKPNYNEMLKLEKNLMSENLSDQKKQTLCNKMEEQVEKLDEICTEWIQISKPEVHAREFVVFSDIRSHYRDMIKLYRHSKDCGNQTSLVSSTSAGDKDPN